MEVTFDSSSGEAFASKNGQPIEAVEPVNQPLPQEDYNNTPDGVVESIADQVDSDEFDDDAEELEETDFSPTQQAVINKLGQMGLDVPSAFEWADSDDCTLDAGTYDRLANAITSDDPMLVELGALAVSFAKNYPDSVADDSEQQSFSQEQEHQLVDEIGGENASEIVNLSFKLAAGEIDKEQAFAYVSQRPSLRNAFIRAVQKDLITVQL